ncbi:uncharacterized protein LOC113853791 [Abrus precatorius]|uniref:non-specific serine/threonine protein kinase n=1 Tax=Abrus precatorius TaxID=3816 RepID=A0A8B8K935_ABRPR|nr:uncharacterized protein LOC113853791 [Abrus precatorius]
MNDNGNFQLLDQNFASVWESFDHPTDTLVPTQVMELNGYLSSRQGEFNFSGGRFKLHLQEDGNAVLNLINLATRYSYEPYYVIGTADAENQTDAGMKLIFDKSGLLYVEKKSGEKFNITEPNERVSTDDFYYRATINYDGVFTISYHPKDPKDGQGWITADTIPENICLNSTFTSGEGVCGFNSICTLNDNQRPKCNCPEGYSLTDSNNMYGGCIPNFQVICQAGGHRGSHDDLYIMKELSNIDWPKSDYERLSPCSLQECTNSCLRDCLCVLVAFNGSTCLKKKLPLTNGRRDQRQNGTSVMKLMKNDDSLTSLPNPNEKNDHEALIIVISVLLGSSVLVILMLVGTICFGFSCNRKKIRSRTGGSFVDKNLRNFTFKELVEATGNFREELGRGSFSIVYKGTTETTSVAIKKLDKLSQDNDNEFQTEVNVIGQTHHRNLVRLLGYCNEGQHRILVYEFMSNGTLANFLFTPLKPNWNQRFHIALGIARGLVYLHEECSTQIIHCDIKPQNILLDDQYNARISDFGLAKLLLINQSHTETRIRGTKGYVAPDWFRSAPITAKVDTYSFGVMLLEIICCRRNVEKEFVDEDKGILTDWVYDCYKTKRLDILLENDFEAINAMKSFEKLVMIAIWCIQEDPSLRPTMKRVLLMLEGIIEVSMPPNPYLHSSRLFHMVRPTLFFPFLLSLLHISVSGVVSNKSITLVNQCNYTVWPASYAFRGSAGLSTTGFTLKAGESSTVTAPDTWNGRFWCRTLCTTDSATGNYSCATGDCNSGQVSCGGNPPKLPATAAMFNLSADGVDFFGIDLTHGYNVPMQVVPFAGWNGNCRSMSCISTADLNATCPPELKVVTDKGVVVGCQSACGAFKSAQYCCSGDSSTKNTCNATNYSLIFKRACPEALTYWFDDRSDNFTCSSSTNAGFNVIFCPADNSSLGSLAKSVRVGDSLTASNGGNGTTGWLSPSGDFAFGFYQLPNMVFLLAVWYDKIPNKTIIWYANGDNPAPIGSRLELTDSLGLVLRNPQGSELWKSGSTSSTIYNGLMNDSGNFQLLDQNFVPLWDSFNHPTDTLLPTQVMNLNGYLSSRQGEFNFSRGRFKLLLQQDGNLVLNLVNLSNNNSYKPYYDTQTADSKNQTNVGMQLIFDKSGYLYVLKKSGEKFKISEPDEKVSIDDFYYKATINYDGVFAISSYPKDPSIGTRWVTRKAMPENICLTSISPSGDGVCGLNSICTLNDDQRPICNCPEGYSLKHSDNMYGDCSPNFQNTCQADGPQRSYDDLYIMKELPNIDWPKSDYETLRPSSLQDCMKSCLQDCLCVLVTFEGSSCWKKKLPLKNGRKDEGVNGTSIMKLMKNNETSPSSPKDHNTITSYPKDHNTLIIVISVLMGGSVLVIIMLVGSICFCFSCKPKEIKTRSTNTIAVDRNLRNFTFEELVEATSNFTEELGRGSFSIVYKGTIDIASVAVKKLNKLFQEIDEDFQTEVNVIGQTHHRNLVRLLGYCNEGQHRILVYEFMSNGTLASFLFTPLKPGWNQRFQIALGIARGLIYLHEECCTQIIHCDIKPQNILLDDQYNARISDFGLAKLLLISESHTETRIRGTKGYVAPDWFRSVPITAKVDTYSFGVLLLEIICCRKNVEKELLSEEKGILTDWAYDCYKTKTLDALFENDREFINNMESFEKLVMIAFWCTQENPSVRPNMKKVLLMLEGIVEVPMPPNPCLHGSDY